MFQELPKTIQQQIIKYLEADNFVAAKQLRDTYCSKFCPPYSGTSPLTDELNTH